METFWYQKTFVSDNIFETVRTPLHSKLLGYTHSIQTNLESYLSINVDEIISIVLYWLRR
jgi:hypothetical protein